MSRPSELLKFLFEFYNYASFVKKDTSLDDKAGHISHLLETVVRTCPESLHIPSAKGASETHRRGSNQGSIERKRDALRYALLDSHYEVFDYSDEYEPLVKVSVGES